MLSFLPAFITGPLLLTGIAINSLTLIFPLVAGAILKIVLPIPQLKRPLTRLVLIIAEMWVMTNKALQKALIPTQIETHGIETLDANGWYIVSCNHQTWVDILVLQRVFLQEIPFLKFFLKQELIWVPIMGIAWWALEFPFMKRYSKEFLAKHPEMKGKDLETTQKACEKFKDTPISIMNFLEGTRFSKKKHLSQNSPYQHLLKPKAGGIAYVLSAMDGKIKSFVDVTIIYPTDEPIDFLDFVLGRISKIKVFVRTITIPEHFNKGNYEDDLEFKKEFQAWVSSVWEQKDTFITKNQY